MTDSEQGATAAALSDATRTSLFEGLTVTLETEMTLPRAHFYPPGAQDYYATFTATWGPGDTAYTEQDQVLLESLARDAGADLKQGGVRITVGHAHLLVVDLNEPGVYEALDAREADTQYLASHLFDEQGLVPQLEEELAVVYSDAVLVNSVHVDPAWRGLRFGLLGTGLALAALRRGCAFAALDALSPGLEGAEARYESHRRLAAYWGRLGFKAWADRVLILDLSLVTFDEAMAAVEFDLLGG